MIGMSRFKVVLLASVVAAGSSACSSTSAQPRDGAADVAAPGTPFACVGGVTPPGGTGGSPGAVDASGVGGAAGGTGAAAVGGAGGAPSGPVTCVVGQSYCFVEDHKEPGAQPSHSCNTLADGGLGVCADKPTCACICGQTNCNFCSCDDSGGFVTIICMQV